MHFNPLALLVTVTFVGLFAAALNGSAWGIVGALAALAVEAWMWAGSFGVLDFFGILLGRRPRRY